MSKDLTRSLMTAGVVAGGVVLDAWLSIYISALPARVALISAFAYVAGRMWSHWSASSPQLKQPAIQTGAVADSALADARMLAEVTTATEHLRSVRLLIEISEGHRQPLPRAVPVNLDLVIKHLDKARQLFSAGDRPGVATGPGICVDGQRPLAAHE